MKADETYALLSKRINAGGATPSQIENAVKDYLDKNEVNVPTDKSLTEDGKAADAKVTGDAIKELSNTVNANIPNDEAVGSQPWTSKHIVDMLCPPIEETGNPVQCYPVPGYPLGITASWEPVQEGSGDPSPDNIRPIKGRDKVSVTRCGQNLLDLPDMSGFDYEIQLKYNEILRSSLAKKCKHFSFSATVTSDDEKNKFGMKIEYSDGTYEYAWLKNGSKIVPHIISNAEKEVINVAFSYDTNFELSISDSVYVAGNVPSTEYLPYQGNTVTMSLPETIYGGSVDVTSGKGTQTHMVVQLDGTENWDVYNDGYYRISFGKTIYRGICSHYKSLQYDEMKRGDEGVYLSYTYAAVFISGSEISSLEEWRAFLAEQAAAGTPVTICYTLLPEEPLPSISIEAQDINALQGINTVLADVDSLVVTGRKDPVRLLTTLDA